MEEVAFFWALVKLRRFISRAGMERRLRKFPLVVLVYNWLYRLLKPKGTVEVNLGDFAMYLDSRDPFVTRDLLMLGVYEPYQTELFRSRVRRGMVVIDVGAHMGYYTLHGASRVGPEGKVYAFEPEPENFSLLCKNIELNRYTNVVAVPKALSNRTGSCQLHLSEKNLGGHRIYAFPDSRRSLRVEAMALDDFLPIAGSRVDVIKMDVEGAEAAVLGGMRGTLARSPELILLSEFFPAALAACGHSPAAYLNQLTRYGFALYYINEEERSLEPTDRQRLLARCRPDQSINLLCLKRK